MRHRREACLAMIRIKELKNKLKKAIFGYFFVFIAFVSLVTGGVSLGSSVYAEPVEGENTSDIVEAEDNAPSSDNTSSSSSTSNQSSTNLITTDASDSNCKSSLGAIGWLVCPVTGKIAEAIDFLYGLVEDILAINPVKAEDGTPIYEIWKYCRGITNIVFIIFLLIVIYSQITGLGINNYGIKKALPKLIIAAILVNLSFVICSLAVDLSNIIGNGVRDVFAAVAESAVASNAALTSTETKISVAELFTSIAGGTALTIGGVAIAAQAGIMWMLIPTALGAIVAIVTGLITIALRQAVVALLVMISPLAVVANILPNTEDLFKKWKDLLKKMLVFYPMFSLLFGASNLAGFALITSAESMFGVLLGVAVQIFPLFFAWSMMRMSGTILGDINTRLRGLADRPLAANRSWADSKRLQTSANSLANGVTPSARLRQFMDYRKGLREEDTRNSLEIAANRRNARIQRKIAGSDIGQTRGDGRSASRYTRNAKAAGTSALIAKTMEAHKEHVLDNYGDYYNSSARDRRLNKQSQDAWIDYNRAMVQRAIDGENDISFFVDRMMSANKRDANNNPVDRVAFDRFITSVGGDGPEGEQRVLAKVISQAAAVESKQRGEYSILFKKYGLNGYNKNELRDFIVGYKHDSNGWALDANGERLRDEHGRYIETVPGDALTKAPDKLVLYDKRDEHGLYFDMKDQDGNVVMRFHRGTGADGLNHDDGALMKEVLANFDIPIGDPNNDLYNILTGIRPGDIITPQGQNEIGLARYSTTIGRALSSYKGDAAWAGAMFGAAVSNRQIKNSAQHAIWALDSIAKTSRPGALNQQSPSSVRYLMTVLDPNNWDKIFTEADIAGAVNIDNELIGGEDWQLDERGNIIGVTPVDNPTHEQRMNKIKRKFIFPAMEKILPSFDRLRTNDTLNNQKQGTADAQYEFLKMVEEKWENNDSIPFDPTLVKQDLQSEARAFRQRKHDEDGNPIYPQPRGPRDDGDEARPVGNIRNGLEEQYNACMNADELRESMARILGSNDRYARALERFDELCEENPNATLDEMRDWFDELTILAGD